MSDPVEQNDLPPFNQLLWMCRRGMLELDVLLGNFLQERYAELRFEDKETFIELLSYQDPLLFAWLMGKERPKNERLFNLTQQIQLHAKCRI